MRAGPRYNRELLDPGPSPVGWEGFADVGVTVPLWHRNGAGVAAAEAEVERARAAVARVELDLRSRLSGLFRQYAAARSEVRVYRDDIAPRVEKAYRLTRDRYEELRAEYADVLAAQRRMLELREGASRCAAARLAGRAAHRRIAHRRRSRGGAAGAPRRRLLNAGERELLQPAVVDVARRVDRQVVVGRRIGGD